MYISDTRMRYPWATIANKETNVYFILSSNVTRKYLQVFSIASLT